MLLGIMKNNEKSKENQLQIYYRLMIFEISSDHNLMSVNFPMDSNVTANPCGGGVEYLYRDPASRKKRRNGTKEKAAP
jgi:hypothetical protein